MSWQKAEEVGSAFQPKQVSIQENRGDFFQNAPKQVRSGSQSKQNKCTWKPA